jgi:hypothetical protein
MSLAAATYDSQPQETLMVPDGGIAAFLNATEGDWATDDIPHTGIAQVRHIADRLAEYGRYEDEFMVHAAEGETVIPLEVLEANPRLKSNLFSQMEKMGLEPERYVVGSELNSLNPVTGQPEFFLKKLFKGVKKLVKKVVKVVKKALPIVLPIALAMTPLGPIFGAATGSGIGTLAAGGDLKDALKAGLTAGALGGMFTGVTGGIQSLRAGNTFAAGFKSSVGSAAGGIGERFKQFASPARAREAGGTYFGAPTRTIRTPDQQKALLLNENLPKIPDINTGRAQIVDSPVRQTLEYTRPIDPATGMPYDGGPVQRADMSPRTTGQQPFGPDVQQPLTTDATGEAYLARLRSGTGTTTVPFTPAEIPGLNVPTIDPNVTADTIAALNRVPADPRSFLERTGDFMFRGGKDPQTVKAAQDAAGQAYAQKMGNLGIQATEAGYNAARAAAGPSRLARFGPSAALASGIAAGTGFFDAPEEEEDETEILKTGVDLLAEDPEKYMIRYPTISPTYTLSDITVPGYGVGYASGGDVDPSQFPRRNGGIAGPGTETSDDVPAMLSDGEFVMTAKAVKGAGNGSRNNGMQTMYGLMRKFERAAV